MASKKYEYDAIIIGTGLGGLITAAYMVNHGTKVLLFEQHTQPGGYFTSFTRKGYTFDGGIQACEDCGMLFSVLNQIGILDRIDLKSSTFAIATPDDFYSYNDFNEVYRFYSDLKKVYPHESDGIDKIIEDVKKYCGAMEAVSQFPNPLFTSMVKSMITYPKWKKQNKEKSNEIKEYFEMMAVSHDDYVDEHLNDDDLKYLLRQMMYAGAPVSFMLSFHYFVKDYYHPKGGFQAMSNALADYITEGGGEIRYKTMVDEIVLEKGRARGVKLSSGEVVRGRFIISNSDMRKTILQMLPPEVTSESYKQMLRDTPVSDAILTIFLGVDIPAEELPVHGSQHISYLPDYKGLDPFSNFENENYFTQCPIEISITSLNDPSLAPEGKTSIVLQCITYMEYADGWKTKNGERTDEYYALKEKIADQVIANVEKLIPGLTDKIEFKAVATPVTNERYTLNSGGATAGWTYDPTKAFNPGKKGMKGYKTPVKNLYLVGHWTMSPGGAPACFVTGRIVSSIIKWKKRLRIGI